MSEQQPQPMRDFVFYNSVHEFVKTWCVRNMPYRCDTGTMYQTYCNWLSYKPNLKDLQPPSQLRFTRYVGNNVELNPDGYYRQGGRLYYDNLAPKRLLEPCSDSSPTLEP